MNRIDLVPAQRRGKGYLDIVIDGRPLTQHFAGRQGAHPSEVSPLGWSDSAETRETELRQFLAVTRSGFESGRVAVLVCEQCGDVGCGAITVRISRDGPVIRWSDWASENGYEPERSVQWPTHPESFEFEATQYEAVFREALSVEQV